MPPYAVQPNGIANEACWSPSGLNTSKSGVRTHDSAGRLVRLRGHAVGTDAANMIQSSLRELP